MWVLRIPVSMSIVCFYLIVFVTLNGDPVQVIVFLNSENGNVICVKVAVDIIVGSYLN